MAEAEVTVEGGNTLPGGFESVEKMYDELTKLKNELPEYKTRKSELEQLQAKLSKYEEAEAKRLDSERSDLEKAQAKIATLEKAIADKDTALTQAQRDKLFERVLSDRLAGQDDKQRTMKRMLYEAAVLKNGDFEDEETLALILDPVEKLFADEQPHGQTVIQQSGLTQQQRTAASGKLKDFYTANQGELMQAARKGK
jgi:myosin heavy subunit